jgi:hypothetical protein
MILLYVFTSYADDSDKGNNLIVNGSFDEWEWAPFTSDQILLKEAKRRNKIGEDLSIDYRGPLFMRLKGYCGCLGKKVEGSEAHSKASLFFSHKCEFGYFAPFYGLLERGKEYHWEIWLKGKGVFIFKAWISAIKNGKSKFIGFPALIKLDATDTWTKHDGTFKVPILEKDGYHQENKISASISIDSDHMFIDDFKVWESKIKVKPEN